MWAEVRANCITAGLFLTDSSRARDPEAFAERTKTAAPLQRGSQPDEGVGAALYRVCAASSFTAGDPGLDGGSHARVARRDGDVCHHRSVPVNRRRGTLSW